MGFTRETWPQEALRRAIELIEQSAAGSRNATLNRAAFSVAAYIGAGDLAREATVAQLAQAAAKAGLKGREARQTISSGLRGGMGQPAWYPDPALSVREVSFRWRGRVLRLAQGPQGQQPRAATVAEQVDLSRVQPITCALAADAALHVTEYADLRTTQGGAKRITWEELAADVAEPYPWPGSKNGLPLWACHHIEDNSRAQRPDGLTAAGHEKHRAAIVHSLCAIVLDYDDEPGWSCEQVGLWWRDVQHVAHTSASHMVAKDDQPALPRGRVVLALSRPVTVEEYELLAEWVLQAGRGRMGAQEIRSHARAYFVPTPGPGGYAHHAHMNGRGLDVDAMLAALRAETEGVVEELEERAPDPEVWGGLDLGRDKDDQPYARKHLSNLLRILRGDRRIQGRIVWDSFRDRLLQDDEPLADHHGTLLREWLGDVYGVHFPRELTDEAVNAVARECEVHPLRDWLDGLEWDGTPRVDAMLRDYFGCAAGPDEDTSEHARLTDAYSRCFMLACVARAYKAGCKHDAVLILRGDQGVGKSTAFRALVGDEWFADTVLPLGTDEAYRRIQGVWVWELAELEGMRKREAEELKSFLSSQADDFRQPYARRPVHRPRCTVFVATTNEETFLKDSTGNRRFWVREASGELEVDALRHDREQLWAEAVHRYRAGEPWALEPELYRASAAAAAQYEALHPWVDLVEEYLDRVAGRPVSMAEVFEHALDKPKGQWRQSDAKILGGILRGMGLEKTQRTVAGRRTRWWSRADV